MPRPVEGEIKMFTKTFTTAYLNPDFAYNILKILERMGWQPDMGGDGKITVNIPVEDAELWECLYNYMIA